MPQPTTSPCPSNHLPPICPLPAPHTSTPPVFIAALSPSSPATPVLPLSPPLPPPSTHPPTYPVTPTYPYPHLLQATKAAQYWLKSGRAESDGRLEDWAEHFELQEERALRDNVRKAHAQVGTGRR